MKQAHSLSAAVTCPELGVLNTSGQSYQDIRDRYGVAPIVEKLRERRLRWYGHAIRSNDNSLAKIGLSVEVDDKRRKHRPK